MPVPKAVTLFFIGYTYFAAQCSVEDMCITLTPLLHPSTTGPSIIHPVIAVMLQEDARYLRAPEVGWNDILAAEG